MLVKYIPSLIETLTAILRVVEAGVLSKLQKVQTQLIYPTFGQLDLSGVVTDLCKR